MGFPRALSSSLLCASLLADQRHSANRQRRRQEIMVSEKFYLRLLTFVALLTVLALSGHFSSFFLVLSCTLHLTVFFFQKCLLKCACTLVISEVWTWVIHLILKWKRWGSSVNLLWAKVDFLLFVLVCGFAFFNTFTIPPPPPSGSVRLSLTFHREFECMKTVPLKILWMKDWKYRTQLNVIDFS